MSEYIGIGSLIIYFFLMLVLVLNMHKKNKLIKFIFIAIILIFIVAMLFVDENIFNSILRLLIEYIYYPTFNSYLITLGISLAILGYSIFNDKLYDKVRIINYIFSCLLIVSYIIFMVPGVDIYSYTSLYPGASLMCLRYVTRTFILWLVVLFNIRYYRYFLGWR